MNNEQEIADELKEIAPNLSALKNKKNAFQVPDNYFDNFEVAILKQVENASVVAKQPKRSFLTITSSIRKLAAIFLLGGLGLFLWKQNAANTNEVSLSSEEIASYIVDNMDEFEEEFFLKEAVLSQLTLDANLNEKEIEIGIDDLFEELDEHDLEDLL